MLQQSRCASIHQQMRENLFGPWIMSILQQWIECIHSVACYVNLCTSLCTYYIPCSYTYIHHTHDKKLDTRNISVTAWLIFLHCLVSSRLGILHNQHRHEQIPEWRIQNVHRNEWYLLVIDSRVWIDCSTFDWISEWLDCEKKLSQHHELSENIC